MILGEALSKIGKQPLATLLRKKVLEPLGLTDTVETPTGEIPGPGAAHVQLRAARLLRRPGDHAVLRGGDVLEHRSGARPIGANQTTKIDDMSTTAVAVGTGELLSKSSYRAMTDPSLLGFGHARASCAPSCFPQTDAYNFGLGVVRPDRGSCRTRSSPARPRRRRYLPARGRSPSARS